MSFRELRNFTEMMRALGYSRPISIENFRNPNFELVLDILHWLVKRYEPSADLPAPSEVHNMQDRVIFLKQAAQLMASKGRIKLNTKRLYDADGYAVKELLKISQVLYSAMKSNPEEEEEVLGGESFTMKVNDLKDIRDLASDITEHGAIVSELLAKEDSLREARQRAISRNLEMADVEKMVRASILAAEENIRNKDKMMADLDTDKAKLESKIKKKQEELERNEKRLRSLQTVRPAFMDEYEKLEEELYDLYREYLERYRNLDYLEFQMEQYNKKEQERIEQNERMMKRMQDKLKEDELKVLRGDVQLDEKDLEDSLLDDASSDEEVVDAKRPSSNNKGADRPKTKSGARNAKVVGSMRGGGADDEDDQSVSVDQSESGSDVGSDEQSQDDESEEVFDDEDEGNSVQSDNSANSF